MSALSSRLSALVSLILVLAVVALTSSAPVETNHDLLTNLGMVKKRTVPNNHRKRLATESRSSNSNDSHMFVIKLPPNPYYYAHLKPVKVNQSPNDINKVPVSFRSNGKPGKIYHWNLPALKKMVHARHGGSSSRLSSGDSKIYNIQKTSPWGDSSANEAHHMKPGKPHSSTRKSSSPKPKLSYYVPQKKNFFFKYFPGNGKPQSFYVMEKSKKPNYHHRLLP
ncbi:uncharacterized protein [Anabrus simplex]|uniref:uncharacterized protein n=1 Tax=Anabrus simplex TaxID=316456 RepID=UPI0035A2C3AF